MKISRKCPSRKAGKLGRLSWQVPCTWLLLVVFMWLEIFLRTLLLFTAFHSKAFNNFYQLFLFLIHSVSRLVLISPRKTWILKFNCQLACFLVLEFSLLQVSLTNRTTLFSPCLFLDGLWTIHVAWLFAYIKPGCGFQKIQDLYQV